MKTNWSELSDQPQRANRVGFTLLDLLVVIGVIAVLIVLQLPVWAAGKSQSKIAVCASHVRQLVVACQIYANEYNNLLPGSPGGSLGVGAWPWDVPVPLINPLLKSGAQPNTFYCPGTSPRFTDVQNWAGVDGLGRSPDGNYAGSDSTLWNYGVTANPPRATDFRIIGYALAFSGTGSSLSATNQNYTILPERIANFPTTGTSYLPPLSERVLVADATICASTFPALPGYAHPENNYTSIPGGFRQNGVILPHVSPHLKGNIPAGGNLGFKDGHVDWRKFELMTPRTTSGACFWW